MTYTTISSYSGVLVKVFPDAADAEVLEAIGKADTAFLAWRETSFADRAAVMRGAVRIANDSPFGLSVFTSDSKHGAEVARRISTSRVFVNHPTMVNADLPFGGVRRSGYGRELLGPGIKEFVNHKVIDVRHRRAFLSEDRSWKRQ